MPEADSLRDLLRRKVDDLAHRARADGDVPPDAVESLDRLARLVELEDRTTSTPPARWPLGAILAATLLLGSLLLFLRVGDTEIELELVLSEVGFVLSRPQEVIDLTNLVELRVSGVRDIQVTDPTLSQALGAGAWQSTGALRVAVGERDAGSPSGTVTLSPVTFPADAEVRVSGTPGADPRAVLQGGAAPLRVTVIGAIELDAPGAGDGARRIETPRAILVETDPDGTTLDLMAPRGTTLALAPQLAVEGLELFRIDEFAGDAAAAQPVSTILSGTLYFEALNGRVHQLRPRELLRVSGAQGVIRTLQIDGDRITMNFRGRVQALRSGWGADPANLMPSYLDWLQAQHGLSLLWGTALYVVGVVAAVLRWWRHA
jgi:hypothetical protein